MTLEGVLFMGGIAFCLEDSEKMPISQALKSSYNGSNIYFSNGNDNLAEKMHECLQKGYDYVIGFIDLSPDNELVFNVRLEAVQYFADNNIMNSVALIPLICTEYKVLRVLDKLNCLFISNNYISVWNNIKAGRRHGISGKTLEQVCKEVLGASRRPCQRNTNNGKMGGIFYTSSCTDCYRHCYNFSKSYKSEWIYSGLPCFNVMSDKHKKLMEEYGIAVGTASLADILVENETYFLELCRAYGVSYVTV